MPYRRFESLLFALAWISYAYFHQGGGWNQNGRFALTRALVEAREPWIDDYAVYVPREDGARRLQRVPVRDASFVAAGKTVALGWYAPGGPLTAVSPTAPAGAALYPVESLCVTGDLAFARGHLHPNKAPGASFAAVPGYAAVWAIEKAAGVDPDAAAVLTANAWLAGALGVGLLASLGVVAFWRLAMRLSKNDARASLFATVAFAFGTLYFPYATMLYDHDVVAAALTASFLLLWPDGAPGSWKRPFAAGACAGAAVVASYLSVVALAILGGYALLRSGRRALAAFVAGTLPPLALLAAYNVACFGRVITTNYAWQNPYFKDAPGNFLDVFAAPDLGVLAMLLVSPLRGIFAITPVLILGAIGLVAMFRSKRWRLEALVVAAMLAHVLAFNVSFKAWHGGYACGPRYLIPAIPFLALPIVLATRRAALARHALLAVSIAGMALVTLVDPQPPWVESGTPPAPPPATVSPVWSIDLPQFLHSRPGAYGTNAWRDRILARYVEPVSANPGGIVEGLPGRFFPQGSAQSRWNSFNLGELLFPGSRASVVPWLAAACALGVLMKRELDRIAQRAV